LLRLANLQDYLLKVEVRTAASVQVLEELSMTVEDVPLEFVTMGWLADGSAHVQWRLRRETVESCGGDVELRLSLPSGLSDQTLCFAGLAALPIEHAAQVPQSLIRRVISRIAG
jgi:hypothetical protein